MIVGITTTLNEADHFQRVNTEYIDRIAETGAVPVLLTPVSGGFEANRRLAERVIDSVDALLLTGGGDIHPRHYIPAVSPDDAQTGKTSCEETAQRCRSTGQKVPFCRQYASDAAFREAANEVVAHESDASTTMLDGRPVGAGDAPAIPCLAGLLAVSDDRDGFELELARLAHERDIPTLGICRGMQVMNVALGGSLYLDLNDCGVTEAGHRQQPPYNIVSHSVALEDEGALASALCKPAGCHLEVNTMHHQGVDRVAPALVIRARSTDGVIESVEDPTRRFFVGVQWHPEYLDAQAGLFSSFVAAGSR